MLISKVELPVWAAAQAARFYGDVLGMPIRTGGGVVEVGVGSAAARSLPGGAGRVPLRHDRPQSRRFAGQSVGLIHEFDPPATSSGTPSREQSKFSAASCVSLS